ncbi:MAG: CDP-alcohol phosphatidyltransferase family protein [Gammaproteobacteria bacterium]|nr:CDP-alcohol phosphatidyltransferase family protein [Gammaproteobacteria bacterium]
MNDTSAIKPWDARLAYRLVYPLRRSRVTPNHLTTLRLAFGLAACLAFAQGGFAWSNVGALCFAVSTFLDHADGELARITGKSSRWGHYYDLVADATVNVLLFVGIGIGLTASPLGWVAVPMGVVAGLSVAAIFHMRHVIELHVGKTDARQPNLGWIEAEDVFYLLPLVGLARQVQPFLVLATVGAPLYALWVLREYRRLDRGAGVA